MSAEASKLASEHSVCFDEEAVKQMKRELDEFLKGVNDKKAATYQKIFSRSVAVIGIALVLLALGVLMVLSSSIPSAQISTFTLFYVYTSILLSAGGVITIAVIPTEKYNFDDWERSPICAHIYLALRIVMAFLVCISGPVFFLLGGNVAGPLRRGFFMALFLAFSAWLARSVIIDLQNNCARDVNKISRSSLPPPSLLLSDCLCGTITFALLLLSMYYLNDTSYSYIYARDPNFSGYFRQVGHFTFGVGFLLTFIFVCGRRLCGYTKCDSFGQEVRAWRARAAQDTILSLLFGIAATFFVQFLVVGISFKVSTVCDPSCSTIFSLHYFSALDILAAMVAKLFSIFIPLLFFFGSLHYDSVRTFLFRQLAEWWGWENVEERQKAGAQLAAATNIQVTDWETNIYWCKRLAWDSSYKSSGDVIQRELWMPGHIDRGSIKVTGLASRTFSVRIFYREDIEKGWSARFSVHQPKDITDGAQLKGPRVVFSGASLPRTVHSGGKNFKSLVHSQPPPSEDEDAIQAWRSKNFDSETPILKDASDPRGPYVIQTVTQAGSSSLEPDGYSRWALSHFRSFSLASGAMSSEMLNVSPRDIDPDTEPFWTRSKPLEVARDTDKLDYFISHTWDDNKESTVLKNKIEQFGNLALQKPSGTVWFDQACLVKWNCSVCKKADCACSVQTICPVCKDASCDPQAMSFATLPIAVGNCTSLLVMLSPTYLNRLWCIFELYTVFAFAIPEVSVGRVSVVRVPGPALKSQEEELEEFKRGIASWTLDQAHCFDPNEEFKIRQVAYALGEEELKKCVRALASCNFVQLASPPWWRRWPLPELREGLGRLLQLRPCARVAAVNQENSEQTLHLLKGMRFPEL